MYSTDLFFFVTVNAADHVNDDPNHFKLDSFQKLFESKINSFEWRICLKCNKKFFVSKKSKLKCIHGKGTCAQYTDLNEMDPGEVPDCLQGLTYIEEQVIARIHPMVTVFKLKGHQYGYSGNVINFPQDVNDIARNLPHRLEDLRSVLTVKTRSDVNPVEFQIRSAKVRSALEWFIENNPLYDGVELSEDNLRCLPEDDNVYELVKGFEHIDTSEETTQSNCNDTVNDLDDNCTESDSCSDMTDSNIEDCGADDDEGMNLSHGDADNEVSDCEIEEDEEEEASVVETGVPMIGRPSQKQQIETALEWPSIGERPVNEFSTNGYIAMAYPCLYAYGKADINCPREQKVSALNYFRHLMRYKDGRFAQHPRFRFFALNSLMRWSALKDGNMFVKRHPEFKDMTVHTLKEELSKNPNLLNKILFQSSNIRGTRAFWYARGKELVSMVEQIGLPTLFFTLSCADFHWPDLFKILAPDEDVSTMTETRRRKLIQDNPQVVDKFFYERAKIFIEDVSILRKVSLFNVKVVNS